MSPRPCRLTRLTELPVSVRLVREIHERLLEGVGGGQLAPGELRRSQNWIGLAHAQLEIIHPFLDGNGRIGRLLVTFLLTERDILSRPVLYLSHYFKRHRQAYYDHLQALRERGDWEGWLAFFFGGEAAVSTEAAETARRILALREQHRAAVSDRLGQVAGNGHARNRRSRYDP